MSFRNESVAEFMFNAFSEVRGLGQRPGGLAVADSVGPLGSTVRVFQAAGCTESDLDCLLKLTTSEVIAAQVSASQHVPSINALAVRVVCVLLRLPHPCLMFWRRCTALRPVDTHCWRLWCTPPADSFVGALCRACVTLHAPHCQAG